jgi:hypothetical protein
VLNPSAPVSSGSFSFSYNKAQSTPMSPPTIIPSITTVKSGSYSYTPTSRTTTVTDKNGYVICYKTIKDLTDFISTSVKQEEQWSENEETDEQINLFKKDLIKNHLYHDYGKPFIGIVTEITLHGDKNSLTIPTNTKYFRILFEDNKCYWFNELNVRPMFNI